MDLWGMSAAASSALQVWDGTIVLYTFTLEHEHRGSCRWTHAKSLTSSGSSGDVLALNTLLVVDQTIWGVGRERGA